MLIPLSYSEGGGPLSPVLVWEETHYSHTTQS